MMALSLASTRQLFGNFVAATCTLEILNFNETCHEFDNMTMRFMRNPLKFQVLLQQSCQKVA